jgi:hypothetical protein
MSVIIATILFVCAAYFVVLAFKDTYAPSHVYKIYGRAFGNDPSLFLVRLVLSGLLIIAGVSVLVLL